MGFSGISQIAMFIISILLVVMFVQPTLIEIKEVQDDIFTYSDTVQKITDLNAELASLVSEEKSIRQSDMRALEDFLPTTSDPLQVMADISAIAELSSMSLVDMATTDSQDPNQNVQFEEQVIMADPVSSSDYEVTLEGSYDDLKVFLSYVENNKYILEVANLTFGESVADEGGQSGARTTTEGGDASTGETYALTLRTYTLAYEYGVGNNTTDAVMDDSFMTDPI